MIQRIAYRGPFLLDTSLAGERKADGVVPAHGNGALQVSRDRWMIFVSTLDVSGWDTVQSIIYQLRAEAPDGRVLREGIIARYESGWDPLGLGVSLRKAHGMPMAFGVPRGALYRGRPMPNENVFAVRWSRRILLESEDGLLTPGLNAHGRAASLGLQRRLNRGEWMQFRLNEREDDIQILRPAGELRQRDYEHGDVFCSLGPGRFMNHAMTPPVAADEQCTRWVECDTFDALPGRTGCHGRIAPVEYTWNARTGLYEWTRTGALAGVDGRVVGESSISRFAHGWVIAARSFYPDCATVWFRTPDPFVGLGEALIRPGNGRPRHAYRCADGGLRLFINDLEWSPHGDKRNPLYVVEVDPHTLEYSPPRVVVDLRTQGLPFTWPYADMAKLCPNQGRRQLLVFRTIDAEMTSYREPGDPELPPAAYAQAGLHYAELTYKEDVPDPWTFV